MPWSNQSGGGGGPWGQGPKQSGPQGSPPDLEDIIRRGQDRLRRVLPGGGRNGSALVLVIVLVLIVLWLFKAVYTVQPDEQGVELRFGQPKAEISHPGLHFHWWPIETVEIANTAEKLVEIGDTGDDSNTSGLMLSGDQNIVNVKFSVAYEVADPKAYLFHVADPDEMVRQVAESAMREVVGRKPAQDVFRDDRQGIAKSVKDISQGTLNSYGSGLRINAISIEDAAPPHQVADAFDEVQRAEQDEDRFVQEANKYSNKKLGQARGQAAQIEEEAAAYKNRVVQQAQGEAQRFTAVDNAYAKAPDVTRRRIYLETMEKILADSNKLFVDESGGKGVIPYLALPQLKPRSAPPGAGTDGNASGGNASAGSSAQTGSSTTVSGGNK